MHLLKRKKHQQINKKNLFWLLYAGSVRLMQSVVLSCPPFNEQAAVCCVPWKGGELGGENHMLPKLGVWDIAAGVRLRGDPFCCRGGWRHQKGLRVLGSAHLEPMGGTGGAASA